MSAIYYLNSAAGGADPWATMGAGAGTLDEIIAKGLVAGDVILMNSVHDDNSGGYAVAKDWDSLVGLANPIPIISVNVTTEVYEKSTSINFVTTTSGDNVTFADFSLQGVYVKAVGEFRSTGAGELWRNYDCKIEGASNDQTISIGSSTNDNAFYAQKTEFASVAFRNRMEINAACTATFDLCSWTGAIATGGLVVLNGTRTSCVDYNFCDFDGITTGTPTIVDTSTGSDANFIHRFVQCRFPASYSLTDGVFGNDGQVVEAWSSDDGSIVYPQIRETYRGLVDMDTGSQRGYSDGFDSQTQSMQLTADSTNTHIETPLVAFDICQPITATGTKTATIEILENYTTAIQKSEAWCDFYYYDGTDVLVSLDSTRILEGGSDGPLASGASDWTTGISGSRSVKFESSSLTIGKTGWLVARVHLGIFESAKEFFVDPQMTIA